MKKIKVLIVVCIIIIIAIIAVFIIINNNSKVIIDENKIIENEQSMGVGEFSEEKLSEVDISEGLKVRQCINNYLDLINKNNSAYYSVDDNNNSIKVADEGEIKSKIYNVLSENYINKNKITIDNVYEYVDNVSKNQMFTILEIKKKINTNSDQYIAKGIIEEDGNLKAGKYFIVNLNSKESTYSIEPVNQKIDDINDIQLNDVIVEKNNNNKTSMVSVTAESISQYYLANLKSIIISYPKEAYNRLEEEYREKRFGNFESFEKFVNDNKKEISQLSLLQYKINAENESIQYLLVDKYSNIFEVNLKSFADYTVKLDTYTILTEKFKTTYDSSNEERKVMMNVDKWIEMLNNRDYTAAYDVLDETFRNNNFASEEKFEAYMREKLPLHYKATYGEFTDTNNTYVQKIVLTDITGENTDSIDKNIIMQLKDDYSFVMSFDV